MKRNIVFAIGLFALGGCADLAVTSMHVVWNDQIKLAAATVTNSGQVASEATMLYFDGNESPTSPNYRPQVTWGIGPLTPGQSVIRLADFAPLARPENQSLGNVFAITARVDPNNVVRETNENNNARKQAVRGSPYTCINFNGIDAGTAFGTPAGQIPGTTIISQGGVRVTVENFRYVGTGGTFSFARIDAASATFGAGNVVRLANINLDFDFTGIAGPVKQVVFRFADIGGFENLAVNGSPSPIYAGELTSAPSPLGGAIITSTSSPMPGGKKGTVALIQLAGAIAHLRVGGQEFFMDDVCFK